MKHQKLIALTMVSSIALCSGATQAQIVEKIYPATACDTVLDYDNIVSSNQGAFLWPTLRSIQRLSGSFLNLDCPVVRQKINSAAGAKFYAYFTNRPISEGISCTLESRRPHNGVLVSSGTRGWATGAGPTGDVLLARSIAPSSTWGQYNFHCQMTTTTAGGPWGDFLGYRIKEF